MGLMRLQVLLVCGFLAFLALILAAVLWVTARRAADGEDAFIRRLPPPSQPLAVREAHLRLLVHQELIKFVKVDAVIAGAVVVLGVAVAASDQAPIGAGIAVTAILTVTYVVGYAVMSGLHVLSRYLGAQRRLRIDDVWHAGSQQSPAMPNDAEHSPTPWLMITCYKDASHSPPDRCPQSRPSHHYWTLKPA